jgi:hypothetical protein
MPLPSRLCFFEEQLHTIRSPCGDAGPKEIAVFGPNRTAQRQRRGEHRPIVQIARGKAPPSGILKRFIRITLHWLDDLCERVEERQCRLRRNTPLRQNLGEMFRASP